MESAEKEKELTNRSEQRSSNGGLVVRGSAERRRGSAERRKARDEVKTRLRARWSQAGLGRLGCCRSRRFAATGGGVRVRERVRVSWALIAEQNWATK